MAIKSGVKVIRDDWKKVRDSILALADSQVLVGIPADRAQRKDNEPINNAEIGYIMENGSPDANIPARPHLIPGVKKAQPFTVKMFREAALAAMVGNHTKVLQCYHAAGLNAVNEVRAKITTGPFIPLSPRTIAARRARGRKGTAPLIDTGQYRRNQTYVVRKRTD